MAKVFLFPEGKDFGVDKGLNYSDPFFPLFPELTSYCQSSNEFIKFFQHHWRFWFDETANRVIIVIRMTLKEIRMLESVAYEDRYDFVRSMMI